MTTGSHTQEKPKHFILSLSGGGITVLQEFTKLVFLGLLANRHPLELFSGGIIMDSGAGFIVGPLQKLGGLDALHLFVDKAPQAMPNRVFLAKQALEGAMPRKEQQGKSRFAATAIHEALKKLLGDMSVKDMPHGLSIGVLNLNKAHTEQIAEHPMVVRNTQTGEHTYINLKPDTKLSDVIIAASTIPTIHEWSTIEGLDGVYVDPTIDQDPGNYIHRFKTENPDAEIELIHMGGFTPSPRKLQKLLEDSSALEFKSWLIGIMRQAYVRSSHLQTIRNNLGIPVRNFETEITPEDTTHPKFNPLDTSEKQLRRLMGSALKDIAAKKADYLALATDLALNNAARNGIECPELPDDQTFDACLSRLTGFTESLLPEKRTPEKTPAVTGLYNELAKLLPKVVTTALMKTFSSAVASLFRGGRGESRDTPPTALLPPPPM